APLALKRFHSLMPQEKQILHSILVRQKIEEESTTSPSLFSLAWTTLGSSTAIGRVIEEVLSISSFFF
ncbi:hypothetical protein, partial [Klebsiella pneumoniae]|uniref:hypothetical protein n=1 Tax=Klebsiella pneumoniae TaxID=573 RepID=UPI001D1144CF